MGDIIDIRIYNKKESKYEIEKCNEFISISKRLIFLDPIMGAILYYSNGNIAPLFFFGACEFASMVMLVKYYRERKKLNSENKDFNNTKRVR